MNGIRPIMSTGIPELNPPVLPMDPMAVDKVYLKHHDDHDYNHDDQDDHHCRP